MVCKVEVMLKLNGILLSLFLPACLLAQEPYKESPFAPGLDPDKPSPITLTGKLKVHASRGVSPRTAVLYLFVAGFDQATNSPGAWGRGAEAYGKRYGSDFGRNVIRESIAFGMDGILKTDPRVYRSRRTSFVGRLGDAFAQTVVTRTDSGKRVPAIASLGSAFAAGQISTIWLPERDSRFSDGLIYAGTQLAGDATRNVCREFWPDIKHLFHH
jgi:hypothetical protein